MRLWSLHPRHLDPPGLVALWREALLAQAVLAGATRGYTNHPQLLRFRECADPNGAIARYLHAVSDEADARGYRFNRQRIQATAARGRMRVTEGQLLHEWEHLRAKLRVRNPALHQAMAVGGPAAHPMFKIVPGPVAPWERGMAYRLL